MKKHTKPSDTRKDTLRKVAVRKARAGQAIYKNQPHDPESQVLKKFKSGVIARHNTK